MTTLNLILILGMYLELIALIGAMKIHEVRKAR